MTTSVSNTLRNGINIVHKGLITQKETAIELLRDSRFRAPLISIYVATAGGALHDPVTTFFYLELGTSTTQLGEIQALAFISAFLLAPIYGHVLDTYGSYFPLIISCFFCGLGCFIRCIAPNSTWLYISSIILGLGGGNLWTVTLSHLSVYTEDARKALVVSAFVFQVTSLRIIGKASYPLWNFFVEDVCGVSDKLFRYRIHMSTCTIMCLFGFIYTVFFDGNDLRRLKPPSASMSGSSSSSNNNNGGKTVAGSNKISDEEERFNETEMLVTSTNPASISSKPNPNAEWEQKLKRLSFFILLIALFLQASSKAATNTLWPLYLKEYFDFNPTSFSYLLLSSTVFSTLGISALPIVGSLYGEKKTLLWIVIKRLKQSYFHQKYLPMHCFQKIVIVIVATVVSICSSVLVNAADYNNYYKGSKPNVLIFFADDLGYGDLSDYGHPTTSTPNLAKLASKGVKFTQWYSAFHVCSPSRGSMMTGRLPIRTGTAGDAWYGGVFNADAVGGLPTNETTIAKALKTANYATKAIGKWHLGQQPKFLPIAHGFDEYYGIPYSDDMGPSAWYNYKSVDRPPLPLIEMSSEDFEKINILEQPTDLNLLTSRYVKESVDFINKTTAKNVPFFLYMAFNHVHVPDFANPKYCNSTLRGRFGDALAEMDDAVGQILNFLYSIKAEENTIVFFTSDNGPWLIKSLAGGNAGLLRGGKQTTWEGGVREPGIVSWPGKIKEGWISRSVVTTYDIFATVLPLAGVELPNDRIIDGKDMSPILFDSGSDNDHTTGENPFPAKSTVNNIKQIHDCIYIYKGANNLKCPPGHENNCTGLWAVRCGEYKLHYVTSNYTASAKGVYHNPPLIYHIEHDPGENFPLDSNSDEYKEAFKKIDEAAEAHRRSVKPVPNQMALGLDPKKKVCCDWNSKNKYPDYPVCTCNPDNFHVFVCAPVGPTIDNMDTKSDEL
eukprot:g4964.t1